MAVGSLSSQAADAFQRILQLCEKKTSSPGKLFLLLAGYASASTLALLFFIVQYLRQPYHQLESLPDIKPPATGISVTLINPDNRVAPLHTLQLNQTRRFGNIEFTPLKVTRGPISIVQNASNSSSETTEPVLKLLVRFKNVSRIRPLSLWIENWFFFRDRRVSSRANQFIKWADQLASDTGVINLFELPLQDEVSIANMPLGIALAPGESIETFLPSRPEVSTNSTAISSGVCSSQRPEPPQWVPSNDTGRCPVQLRGHRTRSHSQLINSHPRPDHHRQCRIRTSR